MQNQEPGNNLFCIYRDCEDLALFGDYCRKHQFQRAESAESRAAQLETDNDVMQSYINEIRVALYTEKDELTIDAVRRVISERDTAWSELREIRKAINADENEATSDEVRRVVAELARKLEQAQQTLRSIEDQAGRAALVQDRSVSIIKQTCKIIADKAKAAMAA